MRLVELNLEANTYRGPWEFPDDTILTDVTTTLDDAIQRGFKPESTVPPVPFSVAKWAFLLVIRQRGKEDALKSAIAAYNGANAAKVRAKWEADPDIERNGATINALGAAIGYTPAQVDDIFREAQTIENS